MLSRTLSVSADTDTDAVVRSLREDAERRGMKPASIEVMVGEVEPLLRMVVASGRAVASTGGQFQAAKEIAGDGFRVRITAKFGPKKRSFFSSLFGKKGS